VAFAVSTIGFTGFMVQSVLSNSITAAFEEAYGLNPIITTLFVVAASAFVVFGSVQRLAKICEKVVPLMAVVYIGVAVFVIIKNIAILPATIGLVVGSAFGGEQVIGSIAETTLVWDMGDLFMGVMTLINVASLFMLSKTAFAVFADYKEQKAKGIDPVFIAANIEGLTDVECWGGTPSSVEAETEVKTA